MVAYSPDETQRWHAECDGEIVTDPAIMDDSVVVGGDGWVSAFDGETGTRRWANEGDCGGLGSVETLATEKKRRSRS